MSDQEHFQAALAAKRRRQRPSQPYRPVSRGRLDREIRAAAQAHGLHGDRVWRLTRALLELLPKVQSGVAYMGDDGMAKLMGRRAGKTAHRAKFDALRCGLIHLTGSGPKRCPCGSCGGEAAGGKILNGRGQLVSAATGYEFDPRLLGRAGKPNGPRRNERAISTRNPDESMAERRLREEGRQRMAGILEQLRARPGP